MSRHRNRLIHEASPYLRQHAHNPVDWYPWGEEALSKAKKEDKPILLSIGYSACHWCHVMERESFDNEDIARRMNEDFISIKVDREERPDLDTIYQLVVQMMGRSGGWPLTVFLTPDQKPFFGGTYFPPEDKFGMPAFPRVLESVAEAYRERPAEVRAEAEELILGIGRAMELPKARREASLGPDFLERVSQRLSARFDERYGGFGAKPKFPNTLCLDLLLRHAAENGDSGAKARIVLALDNMRKGGIWDHLGGGFHRYSTDERWLVPHFEKMLYDNAMFLRLYTDAYRAFGEERFADTARGIGSWLLSEMQRGEGGFYCALGADTEGEEGKYYVFSEAEVDEALGGDSLALAVAKLYFGITREGNFGDSAANVLHEARALDDIAIELAEPLDEVESALLRAKESLLQARSKRERPFRDEKVLASWNGLTIAALADASQALEEPSWLSAAIRAFAYIESTLVEGGEVSRLTKTGDRNGQGFLDDYAFVAWAALALYEATGEVRYLERARLIADEIRARFLDPERGDFFFTESEGHDLIIRAKDPYDQSIPSGASIAALVFSKLGAMVDEEYAKIAERYLVELAKVAIDNPFAFGEALGVLDGLVRGATDIVIVGHASDDEKAKLLRTAYRHYLPNRNIVRIDPAQPATAAVPKLLAEGKDAKEESVAYVCRGRACSLPIHEASALESELRSGA